MCVRGGAVVKGMAVSSGVLASVKPQICFDLDPSYIPYRKQIKDAETMY